MPNAAIDGRTTLMEQEAGEAAAAVAAMLEANRDAFIAIGRRLGRRTMRRPMPNI
jgi:glucosamine--fructose-6-phosphate aminotransferase (isomerizing)